MGGSDFRPGFDERREVWRLLGHLDAAGRVAFLRYLCASVSSGGVKTTVTDNDGSVSACWHDLMLLGIDRGLNLCDVGERLARWVRYPGSRPTVSPESRAARI